MFFTTIKKEANYAPYLTKILNETIPTIPKKKVTDDSKISKLFRNTDLKMKRFGKNVLAFILIEIIIH